MNKRESEDVVSLCHLPKAFEPIGKIAAGQTQLGAAAHGTLSQGARQEPAFAALNWG